MDELILTDRIDERDYLKIETDYDMGIFLTVFEHDYIGDDIVDASVFLSYESLRSLRNWINELLEEN